MGGGDKGGGDKGGGEGSGDGGGGDGSGGDGGDGGGEGEGVVNPTRRRCTRAVITFTLPDPRCRLRTRRLERRAQLRALGGELAHDAALGDDARVGAQPQLLALVMGGVEVALRTRSGRACVSTRTLMS
jgi:hypothetical protein